MIDDQTRTKTALMSDAKWRAFFLNASPIYLSLNNINYHGKHPDDIMVLYKFLGSECLSHHELFTPDLVADTYIKDSHIMTPVIYREIECIKFPTKIEYRKFALKDDEVVETTSIQAIFDHDEFTRQMHAIKQFGLEITEENYEIQGAKARVIQALSLFGYK
ncbi:MAG: hypothetical protein AB7I18_04650 [Candidatus Berkiella sp.]